MQSKAIQATGRFPVEVGRWVAGAVERQLRQAAFTMGLDITIERHMGLLDGVLLITVKGDSDDVHAYIKAAGSWIEGQEEGGSE